MFGGEDFLRRAVGGNAAKLGWSHPKTMHAMADLARAQKDQGRSVEAEPLLRKAHQEQCRIFGPHHPTTLSTAILLVEVMEDQLDLDVDNIYNGMDERTEKSVKMTKSPKQQVHGDAATVEVSRTPTTQRKLIKDILELRQLVAVSFEEQYGPKHGATIQAVINLSIALERFAHININTSSDNNQIEENSSIIYDRSLHIMEHAKELREQAEQLEKDRIACLSLSLDTYVPKYRMGDKSGKGQPPVPSFSTRIVDFVPGHAGILG